MHCNAYFAPTMQQRYQLDGSDCIQATNVYNRYWHFMISRYWGSSFTDHLDRAVEFCPSQGYQRTGTGGRCSLSCSLVLTGHKTWTRSFKQEDRTQRGWGKWTACPNISQHPTSFDIKIYQNQLFVALHPILAPRCRTSPAPWVCFWIHAIGGSMW